MEALQASVTAILNKIAALPIEQLVGSLSKTAAGVEAMVNSPELRDGLRAVGPALKQLQQTIGRIDADAGPAARQPQGHLRQCRRRPAPGAGDAGLGAAHDRPGLGADRRCRRP